MENKILLFNTKDKKLKSMKITFNTYMEYFIFCTKYKIGTFHYHDGSKAIICLK